MFRGYQKNQNLNVSPFKTKSAKFSSIMVGGDRL